MKPTRFNPGTTASGQSLAASSSAANTPKQTPTTSLPRSSRFRVQRGIPNFDGALSSGSGDVEYEEQQREVGLPIESNVPVAYHKKGASHTGLINPGWSFNFKSNHRNVPTSEQTTAQRHRVPGETHNTPSPEQPTIGCTGKVSDLRKRFEISATPSFSPSSIKSFWRSRSRAKLAPEEINPGMGLDMSGSSNTLPEHIGLIKRIPVPELTTDISTGDFSCDFGGAPDDPRASTPDSYSKAVAEYDVSKQHESPVKHHIQRFEKLEHDSPAKSLASCNRTKSYEASLRPSTRRKENDVQQMKPQASRHPFRQRSVELWRRISGSFNRAVYNSSDGVEEDNSNTYIGTSSSRPGSVRRQPRYRRSLPFGNYANHTSELARSSEDFSRSDARLSINEELIARFENQRPYLKYTSSTSSHLSMRKTFPFLARMSDSLECEDDLGDFGLDGNVASKVVSRTREKSPTGEASKTTQPRSSISRTSADPNALAKVVSKQTIAERKLRRIEEKQLRKEERDRKRGKTKATGQGEVKGSNPNDGNPEANKNSQNKGKGKEVAGKEKKENSWSKKTASGFMVRQISDIKLKHPKPRRPGQVKKIVNMYKEKASSGIKLGKGSGVGSTASKSEAVDK